jgi:carbon-monoxide dehydrogenase small subunit
MILVGKALIDENPRPSRDEIREAISGVLCRCTGYKKIVDAIQGASIEQTGG